MKPSDIAVLSKWANDGTRLWIEFCEPSKTRVSAEGFVSEVTDERVSLKFGHGSSGTLSLALDNAQAAYHTTDDTPLEDRTRLEPFLGWLEITYPYWGDVCRIYAYKDNSS